MESFVGKKFLFINITACLIYTWFESSIKDGSICGKGLDLAQGGRRFDSHKATTSDRKMEGCALLVPADVSYAFVI